MNSQDRIESLLWKVYFSAFAFARTAPPSFFNFLRRRAKPTHILFCMVDHFEPGTGNVSFNVEKKRMRTLLSKFPELVERHKDSSGNLAKRTWFFPPHYHRNNSLRELVSLCEGGYGEIELHLHHGKTRPDTSENLERTIKQTIEEYSVFGIFGTENGQKKYGFIHGNSALDNSRHGNFCGVNNEIEILKKTGCYADFTFPCSNRASPIKINSIYYAKDKPNKPKSYNIGSPVRRLGTEYGDLMLIQGPLYPFFKENKFYGLRIFGAGINRIPSVTVDRIDSWVKTGIHIKGKRDWIIIKTHTHGAIESNVVLGKDMDDLYTYLETRFNDGYNYILHYVTARELYNIIKAIEAGEPGNNPEEYRNYKIKAPEYNSSPEISEASAQLKELIAKTYIA